jgi:hypothetical protein
MTNDGDLAKVGDIFRRCPANIDGLSKQQNEHNPMQKDRESIALYKTATLPRLAYAQHLASFRGML